MNRRKAARAFPSLEEWEDQQRKRSVSAVDRIPLNEIGKWFHYEHAQAVQERTRQIEAYLNARDAHQHRLDLVWKQINPSGPRTKFTELLERTYVALSAIGHKPSFRDLRAALRHHDHDQILLFGEPGVERWRGENGEVTATKHSSIRTWLSKRNRK